MNNVFLIIVSLLVLVGCNLEKAKKQPSLYNIGDVITSKLNPYLTCIIKNKRYIFNPNTTYEYSVVCVRDGNEDDEFEKYFMEFEIKEK